MYGVNFFVRSLVLSLTTVSIINSSASTFPTNKQLLPFKSSPHLSICADYFIRNFAQCSVLFLDFKNNSNSKMLKYFSAHYMAVGFVNKEKIWSRYQYILQKQDSNCKLVFTHFFTISNNPKNFVNSFVKLIRNHDSQHGVLMRDQDFFVFLHENLESATKVMLSKLSIKLRYKIAIYPEHNPDSTNMHAHAFTVNPYIKIYASTKRENRFGFIVDLGILVLIKNNKLFVDFTTNFYGFSMKMAVFNSIKPTLEVVPDIQKPGNVIATRGFYANLTETIHSKLNISMETFLCHGDGRKFKDGSVTGIKLSNGTWIGCLADVLHNRADIATVAPSVQRYGYVDFLPKHKYDFIKFVSRQPTKQVSWMALFKALSLFVWVLVLISTLGISVVTWICYHFSNMHAKFDIILMDQIRVLLVQNFKCPGPDNFNTTRALCLLWLFGCLILGTAFNSKLTSLMAIPEIEIGLPTDLKSLSMSKIFKVGASKGFLAGLGGIIFKRSKNSMISRLYNRMEEDDDEEICMKRVLTSNYACISWSFSHDFEKGVVFADSRGMNPFYESEDMFHFTPLTQAIRKGEVFRDSYGYFLENMHQMGLNDKWATMDMLELRKERLKSIEVQRFRSNETKGALKISNFLGSFIILLTGLCMSSAIFVNELCGK